MKNNCFSIPPVASAVSLALALSSNTAFAQDADVTKTQGMENIEVVGSYSISEVIDTATGLGLTLRETPQSVSVLTDVRIQDQGLDTLVDAVNNAVGVSVKEVDNVRNTLQSRGYDITNYQIDGVPLAWSLAGDSGETITDVAIYQRVEFVRGATGLLTGAGDPSASINLVRKTANRSDFGGYANFAIGSWNNKELTADLATGLNHSGSVRGRVVTKYEKSDSYVDLFADEKVVFYGVVEADISADTLIRVGGSYQNNQPTSPTWGGLASFYDDGTATNFDVATTTAANWTKWDTTGRNLFANLIHSFSNGWELKVNYNNLNYQQQTKLLYLYGALNKESGEGLATWPYKSAGESDLHSLDVQLKGNFNLFNREHDFVTGALYSEQSANTVSFAALTNAFLPAGNFYQWDGDFPQPEWDTAESVAEDMDTEQQGLYAAARINVSDSVKVIAGSRLASWQRTGVSYGATTDFGDDNVFIPYLGALVDITDNHRVYSSYTEIFQPQNAQDKFANYLDPLTGKSVEIGLKSTLLDDRLHTTFALFSIEQDNLAQADVGEIVAGSDNQQAMYAADGTTSRGFEVELVGQPIDGWNISAGYSQYKAKDANKVEINTDNPRKQFKLFTTYNFVDALPQLTIGGGVNWQDSTYSINGDQRLQQDAYALIDLMARFNVTEALSVQLNLENLADEKYYNQIGFFNQYRYGSPRTITVGVKYTFM